MKISELFERTAWVFRHLGVHTKEARARDLDGRIVDPLDPRAHQWDWDGAMELVLERDPVEARRFMNRRGFDFIAFNDDDATNGAMIASQCDKWAELAKQHGL